MIRTAPFAWRMNHRRSGSCPGPEILFWEVPHSLRMLAPVYPSQTQQRTDKKHSRTSSRPLIPTAAGLDNTANHSISNAPENEESSGMWKVQKCSLGLLSGQ